MTFLPNIRVETELGVLSVPQVECDTCQIKALEELAGGWLNLASIGPFMRMLAGIAPEGGFHFCGFNCLNEAVKVIMTNIS